MIRVPVSIDGRAAVENPFAPRFAADPRVGIDFNGRAGLQFAQSASGSQVIGLALGGSRKFAISASTRNLEVTGNRFGMDLAGASLPNRRGSFGGDAQKAVDYGAAHGALAMTTPGDTSMADKSEVEKLMKGGGARVQR